MNESRPFRFGVVAAAARSSDDWIAKARRIEDSGFDVLLMPDNLNHVLAPFPALAAAATATRTLRIGTYVLANDYRNPVLLAKDAATLDLIAGGRFELGIGAGRPTAADDQRMMGLAFDSAGVRVARLGEALPLIKSLLSGDAVSSTGRHYHAERAAVSPAPLQRPPPILVAASRPRLLTLAARTADIVALGLGPDAQEAEAASAIEVLQQAAGERFDALELNLNLAAVGGQLSGYMRMTLGARASALVESDAVSVLKGDPAQMCDRLLGLRARLGISYFGVGEELMEPLTPVIARLRGN